MGEQDNIVAAIDEFADAMKKKMIDKHLEGYTDWDNPIFKNDISEKLSRNLAQGDYVDVANLAMMLHRFQPQAKNGE
jgi:hypothetical protein